MQTIGTLEPCFKSGFVPRTCRRSLQGSKSTFTNVLRRAIASASDTIGIRAMRYLKEPKAVLKLVLDLQTAEPH